MKKIKIFLENGDEGMVLKFNDDKIIFQNEINAFDVYENIKKHYPCEIDVNFIEQEIEKNESKQQKFIYENFILPLAKAINDIEHNEK